MLTVLRPGLLTLIQDAGRWGWQHLGVPVSGPMDPFSMRLANRLVGNAEGEAALEVTLKGPELRFDTAVAIAITGADLTAALSGAEIPMNQAVPVRPGDVLHFGERRAGARAYLAIRGGVDVPAVLGSRATSLQAGLPGLAGRALRAGDRLSLGSRASSAPGGAAPRVPALPSRFPWVLRAVRGPDDGLFDSGALDRFITTTYRVSPQSNRMGYRLQGVPLNVSGAGRILSEASPIGSVQVPPSGEPILLMADRQTTGGYPRIATVMTADLSRAGQLAPGESIRFAWCSLDEAIGALRQQQALLDTLSRVP